MWPTGGSPRQWLRPLLWLDHSHNRVHTAKNERKYCLSCGKIHLTDFGAAYNVRDTRVLPSHLAWLQLRYLWLDHTVAGVKAADGRGYIEVRTDTTQQSGQTPDKEVDTNHITVYISGCTETDTTGMLYPNNGRQSGQIPAAVCIGFDCRCNVPRVSNRTLRDMTSLWNQRDNHHHHHVPERLGVFPVP